VIVSFPGSISGAARSAKIKGFRGWKFVGADFRIRAMPHGRPRGGERTLRRCAIAVCSRVRAHSHSSIALPDMRLLIAPLLASLLATAPAALAQHAVEPTPRLLVAQAQPAATPPEQPSRRPDIHYVPTPESLVEEMLQTAKVEKADLVYDLGCGDGRIVIMAAKKFGARGIGIDIDPVRVAEATENAKKAGVADRVKFLKQDLFQSDFKDGTVIALYLLTSLNEKLRPKLLAETKPGTRIVSHAFGMGAWQPDASKTIENRNMFYWAVPANVSGQWKVQGTGAPVSSLAIEQSFQKFTGTAATRDGLRTINSGKVEGENFTLSLEGGATVSGTVKDDEMKLTLAAQPEPAWTARREAGTMRPLDAGQ
jgi:SAM-dependent methyltransferase